MIPIVITQPIVEPLTLEQARKHLRVTPYGSPPEHPDDDDILSAITDARQYCEDYTGRSFAEKIYEIALDAFPCGAIELPMGAPLISVDAISYVDAEGNLETLATNLYAVDKYQMPGWVVSAVGAYWPETLAAVNAVKVQYKAGYNDANPLPGNARRALKLVMADFFENRENSTPLALRRIPNPAETLLNSLRLYRDNAT